MPSHPRIKSAKQREIEAEFGCSFREVINGFAEMGYGCNTTAKILDYAPSTFRSLLKRRGWIIGWPALKDQVIMRERKPFSAEARKKLSQRAKERERRRREVDYTFPSDQDRADDEMLDQACTEIERLVDEFDRACNDLHYAKIAIYEYGQNPDDTIAEYRQRDVGGSSRTNSRPAE
jgi:tRNA splicing ligase